MNSVVPIERSYNYQDAYCTPIERYFTERYVVNVRHPGDDYRIYIHSNRVCVITLAPSHNLIKSEKTVDKVDFQVSEKRNTLSTKVSGKRKHGAQKLQPDSAILIAECPSRTYKLCSGIPGKLLEVNQALLADPCLMLTDPGEKGYLAILLPEPKVVENLRENLITSQQFSEIIKSKNSE